MFNHEARRKTFDDFGAVFETEYRQHQGAGLQKRTMKTFSQSDKSQKTVASMRKDMKTEVVNTGPKPKSLAKIQQEEFSTESSSQDENKDPEDNWMRF